MKSTLTQDIVRLAMLGVLVSSGNAMAQTWTSTDVQVLHGSRYTEPFNPNKVNKTILTIENTAGWSWGKTFFFVDTLKSGNQEIGALSGNPESPLEIYGEGYGYLSLSKLSGTKLAFGPIADVNLAAGINAGRKNSELRPRPLAYLAGISFDAALPIPGFASLDVLAYDDHGRTTFGKPNYKTTYQITPAWGIPFELGGVGFEFNGFIDFIGSRGQGTVSQILAQPQLLVDVGRYWGMPKHAFSVGIEYQHWRNKFGFQGVKESTPQIMLKWKL